MIENLEIITKAEKPQNAKSPRIFRSKVKASINGKIRIIINKASLRQRNRSKD